MKNYVLYHANCRDGSGAALAAYLKLGEEAEYIPVQYGRPPPKMDDGSNIHILDFSYKKEILEDLRVKCNSIVVLDHHKTAMDSLKDLPYAVFDMDKSGAHLAWNYFHPGKDVPDLILDIEDRDLWKFKRPDSKVVCAGLLMHQDFREYAQYLGESDPLIQIGNVKTQFDRIDIDKMFRSVVYGQWNGYKVGIINTGQHISELGEKIYTQTDVDFAMMYFVTGGGEVVFSLRSRSTDVSQIASSFGGGGHPGAAGFSIPLDEGMAIVSVVLKYKIK